MRSTIEVRDGRPVVVRTGESAGAEAIRKEARRLAAIAGPGAPMVLEMADDGEHVELVTALAPPLDLETVPTGVAVDALARVADVLQRANTAGIGHGPIHESDILADGVMVLLAGWQHDLDADPAEDVAHFGRLLERLAPRHRGLAPIAMRALAPDAPTLAALAAALRTDAPRARTDRRPLPKQPFAIALIVALAAGVLALVASPARRNHALVLATPSRVSTRGNVVERSGRRWALGEPNDVVVLGHWHCDADTLPAVLHPDTGRIWVFTAWPAGAPPSGSRSVADVAGAVRLLVERDGDCDRLLAVDDHGRATRVR